MNELKPEDVMRALECHYKEWQIPTDGIDHCEQDCPYYGVDNCSVKLVKDAFALLRKYRAEIENYKSIAEYQQSSNMKRGSELEEKDKVIAEKDAEIDRLEAEIKRYENTCGKLIVRDNGEVVGFIEGQEKTYISKEIARVLRSMAVNTARAEAIDEFAEMLYPLYKVLCVDEGDWRNEVDKIAKELKGEKE